MGGVRFVLDKAADRGERLYALAYPSRGREAWWVAGFLAAALTADLLIHVGRHLNR